MKQISFSTENFCFCCLKVFSAGKWSSYFYKDFQHQLICMKIQAKPFLLVKNNIKISKFTEKISKPALSKPAYCIKVTKFLALSFSWKWALLIPADFAENGNPKAVFFGESGAISNSANFTLQAGFQRAPFSPKGRL